MTNTDIEHKKQMELIVATPSKIETADIATWKQAVNQAKYGYRSALYNLYENLLADGTLSKAIEKRVDAITNAELVFSINGKESEEINDLINTQEFEDLLREIMLTRAYGKTVIIPEFAPRFRMNPIPRKNIRIAHFERPIKERKRYILSREYELTGYEYSDDEDILELGKDEDLGFIFNAAPYVLYKRNNFADWAQFAEIFGMPMVVGKYNSADEEAREQLMANLAKMGGQNRVGVPHEANVEVHQNNASGSNTLYKDLRAACNEEILIAVSGETMTTLSGSSRSQAEIHKDTKKGGTKSDRKFVERALNSWLVPLLIRRGYKVAGGEFSFPEEGENLTVKERVDIALRLKKDGIHIEDDYFYKITGIPKPKKQAPSNSPKGGEPKAREGSVPPSGARGLDGFFR